MSRWGVEWHTFCLGGHGELSVKRLRDAHVELPGVRLSSERCGDIFSCSLHVVDDLPDEAEEPVFGGLAIGSKPGQERKFCDLGDEFPVIVRPEDLICVPVDVYDLVPSAVLCGQFVDCC